MIIIKKGVQKFTFLILILIVLMICPEIEANQEQKGYTLMIYMNGSDLESENGAATLDIIEMLDSGINTELVNVLLFTGGTNRWQNNVVPSNKCVTWKISDGGLEKLDSPGLVNMGEPDTLSNFINFSMENYPAVKYGLILWDHGGGSIAGYGHDEKFENGTLTLSDMRQAFENSAISETKLEFLGFDSCLMATVEMGMAAADYANYLVASEDLEPGDGWDYNFLSVLNANPMMSGSELGKAIADYYMEFYGSHTNEMLTISVIDLSVVSEVMDSIGKLMSQCTEPIYFTSFAKKRSGTKTFGIGSPRDNECDMVDIGDMAEKLKDMFPAEAQNVLDALERAVVYNRHNSSIDLKGLSVYYIYGGKHNADEALKVYKGLEVNSDYTNYLLNFTEVLKNKSANLLPVPDELLDIELTMWEPVGSNDRYKMTGLQRAIDVLSDGNMYVRNDFLWPKIGGQNVCLYEISVMDEHSLYAIPAVLNGKECDIIVLFSKEYPNGTILGARQEDGFVIQKGYEKIKVGDRISFYYQEMRFNGESIEEFIRWRKGAEIIVGNNLTIEWETNTDGLFSLYFTDVWGNEYFSELQQF